ncbi:homocysteine S-methyltransferase family protein [uncultured Piscinibacter sp.]|uniref:homocysteine S-methyltransferase family protein n=1 Tax=uncultured Piscinibacter sp. TaxID=1131835 RepID=UPI002633A250|nr:homocysteine S-methyltransferase family protein [uncultured Piscinibacter sp.]
MKTNAPTLPQTEGGWFLTDGGIETTLIYHEGIELPEFAAFVLLDSPAGRETLARYYRRYLDIAAASPGAGFILESPTWRAGFDWGRKLGRDDAAMRRLNAEGVALMHSLRDAYAGAIGGPIVVSGCIGPRGDGYLPGQPMSGDDAMRAHLPQARALAEAGVDMIGAITMTTSGEAIGVARAAAALGKPCAISFTVETDGRLPSGESLAEAIDATDRDGVAPPAYYMVNCAHPTHFDPVLAQGGAWRQRIRGLRANASRCSHAELDAMTTLDDGDPEDLAGHYRRLREPLPALNVLGGCCGTDHRHVAAISATWQSATTRPQ